MSANSKVLRIRGIPLDWDKTRLQTFLDQCLTDNGSRAQDLYMAPEVNCEAATATVQLQSDQSSFELPRYESSNAAGEHRPCLQVDSDFYGLTTLFAPLPTDHQIDVIAVHGLAGHAFGTFRERSGHMWLRDTLPYKLCSADSGRPVARVFTYGYESTVLESQSVQTLAEIAQGLRFSLRVLVQKSERPLIFVGYCMGGLIIKQALAGVRDTSDVGMKLVLDRTRGILFFGCPHDGMDAQSLQLMAQGRPNQALIDSLCSDKSVVLGRLSRDFAAAVDWSCEEGRLQIFNFYETMKTPTLVPQSTSLSDPDPTTGTVSSLRSNRARWEKSGDAIYLVKRGSAVQCRPPKHSADHDIAINRVHYDLVKFARIDEVYERVISVLQQIMTSAIADETGKISVALSTSKPSVSHFVVPLSKNEAFVAREQIMKWIEHRLDHVHGDGPAHPARRVALYGLGRAGKTQIVLSYLHSVRQQSPEISIFWVSAESMERFQESYELIARTCAVPKPESQGTLGVIKDWLHDTARGKWLMVLDNADDGILFGQSPESSGSLTRGQSLQRYLPDCQHGKIIITTRDKEVGRRLVRIPKDNLFHIGPMSTNESRELLLARLESTPPNLEVVDRLADTLEHIPLAMAQAAAYIDEMSISIDEYLESFRKSDPGALLDRGCDLEDAESRSDYVVFKTWIVSFTHIGDKDGQALELLCLMSQMDRSNIPLKYLEQYCQMRWEKRDELATWMDDATQPNDLDLLSSLSILQSFSLVTKQEGNTFTVHRLVHIVTQRWLVEVDKTSLYPWFAAIIIMGSLNLNKDTISWSQIQPELPHITVIASSLELAISSADSNEEVLRFLLYISYFLAFILTVCGRNSEGRTWAEKSADAAVSSLKPDDPMTLEHQTNLAMILYGSGDFEKAARVMRQVVDTRKSQGSYGLPDIYSLASCEYKTGHVQEALELLGKLLKDQTDEGAGPNDIAGTIDILVEILLQEDRHSCLERAEELARLGVSCWESDTNSLPVREYGRSQRLLGRVLLARGAYLEAEKSLQTAFEADKKCLGRFSPESVYSGEALAIASWFLGKRSQAMEVLEQVIDDAKADSGHEGLRESVRRMEAVLESLRTEMSETLSEEMGSQQLEEDESTD